MKEICVLSRLCFLFVFITVISIAFIPAPLQAQAPCTSSTFSPATGNASASGGNYTVTVKAVPAGCTWPTPVSNSPYITISFGGGAGDGSFGYTVLPNTSISPRNGLTISIGSQTYTVNQVGVACSTAVLSPTSATISGVGGRGTFSVTASATECMWTATTSYSWIHIDSGASGTGNGSVNYSVDPNPTTGTRAGTILVGGATYMVTETGSCTFTITPPTLDVAYTGQAGSLKVDTSVSSCTWSTVSSASWASITFGTSGTGNGTVGYNITQNTSGLPRNTNITIGGVAVPVSQAGAPCTLTANPTAFNLTPAAQSGVITVTSTSGCTWQAVSDSPWIAILSGGSGSGNGSVDFSVTQNTTGASRSGTIAIGGVSITISQTVCNITLSTTALDLPAISVTGAVGVTAPSGCTWSSTSSVSWFRVTSGGSGNGNGNVNYTVDANKTGQVRTGSLSIGGLGVTITQVSSSCTVTPYPTSFKFGVDGGSGTINITAPGCVWQATTTADWILLSNTAQNTGNAVINFSAAPNGTTSVRSTVINIANSAVSITVAGQTCSVAVAPNATSVPLGGGTGTFAVTANSACTWTATSAVPWITIKGVATGQGEGAVDYSVDPNPTPAARTGVISVSGAAYTITQPGVTCSLSIAPLSAGYPASGGSGKINVSTNCDWSAVSKADWVVLDAPATGSGDGVVSYTIKENTSTQNRTGVITIGNVSFTVTQSSAACTYSLSPTADTAPGVGASGTFKVTSSAGCEWLPVSDSGWLKVVSWANVSGSGTVKYKADFSPLGAERSGAITVAGKTVFTLKQAAGGPVITAEGVTNAASFLGGPVAPGEIITIFGMGLGPDTGAELELTDDKLSITKKLAETRVLFDGVEAPMVYSSVGQVSAIVPYVVAAKTTTEVKLEYLGVLSNPVSLSVAATSPAIFAVDSSGKGQGAILNQDYRVNSAQNAAARGSTVMIFATGEGQTRPVGTDGQVAVPPLPVPNAAVVVQIGGLNARVGYAGAAPGLVSGVIQINAVIDGNAQTGGAVPVVVRIGNITIPAGVTMAVR